MDRNVPGPGCAGGIFQRPPVIQEPPGEKKLPFQRLVEEIARVAVTVAAIPLDLCRLILRLDLRRLVIRTGRPSLKEDSSSRFPVVQ